LLHALRLPKTKTAGSGGFQVFHRFGINLLQKKSAATGGNIEGGALPLSAGTFASYAHSRDLQEAECCIRLVRRGNASRFYLMALSIADLTGTGAPPIVMEERHQALIAARNQYWRHIRDYITAGVGWRKATSVNVSVPGKTAAEVNAVTAMRDGAMVRASRGFCRIYKKDVSGEVIGQEVSNRNVRLHVLQDAYI
jgi:hypothetical protein